MISDESYVLWWNGINVDVLHCKMYNCQPKDIYKIFENMVIPGQPEVLLKYFGNDRFLHWQRNDALANSCWSSKEFNVTCISYET